MWFVRMSEGSRSVSCTNVRMKIHLSVLSFFLFLRIFSFCLRSIVVSTCIQIFHEFRCNLMDDEAAKSKPWVRARFLLNMPEMKPMWKSYWFQENKCIFSIDDKLFQLCLTFFNLLYPSDIVIFFSWSGQWCIHIGNIRILCYLENGIWTGNDAL